MQFREMIASLSNQTLLFLPPSLSPSPPLYLQEPSFLHGRVEQGEAARELDERRKDSAWHTENHHVARVGDFGLKEGGREGEERKRLYFQFIWRGEMRGRTRREGGRETSYLEIFVGEVLLCDRVGHAGPDVASIDEAAVHLGTAGEEGGRKRGKKGVVAKGGHSIAVTSFSSFLSHSLPLHPPARPRLLTCKAFLAAVRSMVPMEVCIC